MLDIVKKILNISDEPEYILEEQILEEPVVEPKTPLTAEEIYEQLYQQLEETQTTGKKAYFRFFRYLDNELLVKVHGLYGHLPFQLAPWHYSDTSYWKFVVPTAMGTRFRCKVIKLKKDETQKFNILIDASEKPLREAEWIENADYDGIVLDRIDKDLLIDVGIHFRWKYGAQLGYLPLSESENPDIEPGEKITVKYKGRNEKGIIFSLPEAIDLTSYIGKTVWVQACRNENTSPYYMVEGKYRAEMPVTRLIYPEKKRKMQRLREQWKNGDIINCEVMDYKPPRGLLVKCIDEAWLFEINWLSDEMIDYIGKEVEVYVHKSEEEGTSYLIDNLYTAKFPTGVKTRNLDKLKDGDVIICKVYSIDVHQQYFRVRWVDATKQS